MQKKCSFVSAAMGKKILSFMLLWGIAAFPGCGGDSAGPINDNSDVPQTVLEEESSENDNARDVQDYVVGTWKAESKINGEEYEFTLENDGMVLGNSPARGTIWEVVENNIIQVGSDYLYINEDGDMIYTDTYTTVVMHKSDSASPVKIENLNAEVLDGTWELGVQGGDTVHLCFHANEFIICQEEYYSDTAYYQADFGTFQIIGNAVLLESRFDIIEGMVGYFVDNSLVVHIKGNNIPFYGIQNSFQIDLNTRACSGAESYPELVNGLKHCSSQYIAKVTPPTNLYEYLYDSDDLYDYVNDTSSLSLDDCAEIPAYVAGIWMSNDSNASDLCEITSVNITKIGRQLSDAELRELIDEALEEKESLSKEYGCVPGELEHLEQAFVVEGIFSYNYRDADGKLRNANELFDDCIVLKIDGRYYFAVEYEIMNLY